ncbi:restriction endonuclease subunit S [Ureaplasma sp. ES3154-GEN]|uniref:restriction endonuclease subunit S n=1 Tax=Ureaplasma sp. ES3154-GEN TaxID=2984844 RepID=UPI0021E7F790|nr:restriction endonuclease subunit S [Ureaplasma sp. ES3154-GEN]MCV3743455.1 restriction endonuclease subunit S [Ureaplasma sp. ES3154-GEN]
MNIIDLIKKEKVEWKAIADIKAIKLVSTSNKIKKEGYLKKGENPIIDQGQNFISGYTNDKRGILNEPPYVVFGDHTEILKYIEFPFVQGADGIKIFKVDESKINSKYFYYAASNFYQKSGKYKRHFSELKEILIPIPTLEEQEKIVKTLDKFTKYVSELQYRNNQYTYYRDYLLDDKNLLRMTEKLIADKVLFENKKLKDIAYLQKGKTITNKQIITGDIPVVSGGVKPTYFHNQANIFEPVITVAASGSAGYIDYYEKPIWLSDAIGITPKNNVLLKYIYYLLNKQKMIYGLKKGDLIPHVYINYLNNISILLPPLKIQQQVASILDKFSELVTQTTGLLPEEIEKRQKQYEYYREKLLTFDLESGSKQASKQASKH